MPRWRLYKNLLFGFLSENTSYDIFDKTTIFITYLLSFHKFILDFSIEKFSILELNPDLKIVNISIKLRAMTYGCFQ